MKGDLLQWGVKGISALCLSVALVSPGLAAPVVPFGDGGTGLQGVLDSITTAPSPGHSSVDVLTMGLSDANDSYWAIGGAGGSVSTVVIELTGNAGTNTFGIYDRTNPANTVQLFGGAATAGSQVTVSILMNGTVLVNGSNSGTFAGNNFGFYLDTDGAGTDPTRIFYSDTSLNSDQLDHMAAYQGKGVDTIQVGLFAPGLWSPNEYILGWEDSQPEFDKDQKLIERDYNDFVVIVESVRPVPEPSTMMLLGSSLLGLAAWHRRKAS